MSNIPGNFTDGATTITDAASNSATLVMPNGDQSLTGVVPFGKALEEYQSQGDNVGLRKGQRAYPQFTVSAIRAAGIDDFMKLALGLTSGFVSTSVDRGDYPTFSLSHTFNYGAESRSITATRVALTGMDDTSGSPDSVNYTFTIYGALTRDGVTVISD